MSNSLLYPFKFKTIFKEKIWGGNKINTFLGKDFSPLDNCGETWEISAVEGDVSILENGDLKGTSLTSLINTYKEELVGKSVFDKFGNEFPLLIKFLDANDDLSIQVHPNDEIAQKRHNSSGKTEMWYILQADKGAKINVGFSKEVNKDEYLEALESGNIMDILNHEIVQQGDVYHLPAGRVHYIGKGCLIAEIQQTSDITYRIYDFDRIDKNGNKRDLHNELALDCIDFAVETEYKTLYHQKLNKANQLVHCEYFRTNFIAFEKSIKREYTAIDSFIIYVVVEGNIEINSQNFSTSAKMGECVLIPACLKNIEIQSTSLAKFIEVWVD